MLHGLGVAHTAVAHAVHQRAQFGIALMQRGIALVQRGVAFMQIGFRLTQRASGTVQRQTLGEVGEDRRRADHHAVHPHWVGRTAQADVGGFARFTAACHPQFHRNRLAARGARTGQVGAVEQRAVALAAQAQALHQHRPISLQRVHRAQAQQIQRSAVAALHAVAVADAHPVAQGLDGGAEARGLVIRARPGFAFAAQQAFRFLRGLAVGGEVAQHLQVADVHALIHVFWRESHCHRLADPVLPVPAQDTFDTVIPADHPTLAVDGEQGQVPHRLDRARRGKGHVVGFAGRGGHAVDAVHAVSQQTAYPARTASGCGSTCPGPSNGRWAAPGCTRCAAGGRR